MTRTPPFLNKLLALTGFTALLCLNACAQPEPLITHASSTETRVNEQAAEPNTVRVVSFNLYNRPWQRKERLRAATDLLARIDADIVTLQEVATGWILPGDPFELFTTQLQMNAVRHWHERNLSVFKTGLAVLSKYPILSSEYHEFEDHQFWDAKGYMLVKIQGPQGLIQVINLHMASTTDESIRHSEWQELTRYVQPLTHQGSVIVAGDFNTVPTHSDLLAFSKTTQASNIYEGRKDLAQLRSWTSDYQRKCDDVSDPEAELLDYIFLVPQNRQTSSPIRLIRGQVLSPEREPHPSDHCPVVAEFTY